MASSRRNSLPPLVRPLPLAGEPAPAAPLPSEGDLQTIETPALIGRLFATGYSGCLLLVRDGADLAQRALFFERGKLLSASSTLPTDNFPELLNQEGRLSKEQLKRARSALSRLPQPGSEGPFGGESNYRMAEQLVLEQLLPKEELGALLRRHTIEIFYRSFAWERGSFRLLSRLFPEEDLVRLKETPSLLLLEGIRRKVSLEVLLQRIGPENTVLRPMGQGALLLKDAGVTAAEQRALPLFDGNHSMAAVVKQSGLGEHAAYVLAYALCCLLGLSRSASTPAPVPRDSGSRRIGPPPIPPKVAVPKEVEAATALIQKKFEQVQEADYFTLLEVTPNASTEDIQQAYETLRARLSESALPKTCQQRFHDELAEIALVLSEARHILSDEKVRGAYQAHLCPEPGDRGVQESPEERR
jgi:hypothetical protein